jgi:tyrosine aminotransferase
MASLTETVPILAAGGIAKEFLVPGWRVGWLTIHDRNGIFANVKAGLFALTQLILGANSLVLAALPAILTPSTPEDRDAMAAFHKDTIARLEENANFTAARLAAIPGLEVVTPQGAMYVMFGMKAGAFRDLASDVEFAQALLAEENVFVLPGTCFCCPNFCRIVFCAPKEKLSEAFDRMVNFCARHAAA